MIRTYPFLTPANYAFDTNKCEVDSGKGRPTNIIDVYKTAYNATFFANYEADINGLWGNGSLTGTPTGGAAVSGGKLDLKAWGKYVSYDAINNADSQQVGCIEVEVIPDFTVAANRAIICVSKAHGDQKNRIQIMQWNNGQIKVTIVDKDGVVITDQLLSVWNPVQGQPYTFSLNWDITAGATRLFINGTQHGITMTDIGLRDNNIGLLRIGADFNGANNTINAEINNFLIFSTVQHVANYTPDWSVVPITLFSKENDTIEINETIRHEKINSIAATEIKAGSDEIKYIVKNGTKWYWYDGVDIVETNDTYAQSNTLAEWQAVLSGWVTGAPITTKFKVFLHSHDGSTRPEIDEIVIDYDFYGEPPDTINKCIVWGMQKETDGDARTDDIKINLENDPVQYKDHTTIRRESYTVTPDVNGYWEKEIIETENMKGNQKYIFKIGKEIFKKPVPNEESKNFYDL